MTEIFESRDINGLIQDMFAHIKTQVQNPQMPGSGYPLDQIIHLHINFHNLVLTRGSSYIQLTKWSAKKKVVINHKEFAKDLQQKLGPQHYGDRCITRAGLNFC